MHIIEYNGRILVFLKNHLKPKLYGSSYKETVGFSYLCIFFCGIIFFMIIFLNRNDLRVIYYWYGVIFSSAGIVRKRKKTALTIS